MRALATCAPWRRLRWRAFLLLWGVYLGMAMMSPVARVHASDGRLLDGEDADYQYAGTLRDRMRREDIARFLEDRKKQSIMCLYSFDRVVHVSGATQDGFQEQVGHICPFGDLLFDPQLVETLYTQESAWQLGAHLRPDPGGDPKRVQVASSDVASARDFFSTATTPLTGGVSFEMAIRRRAEANHSMTLFSIGNPYGGCVDPGFRFDLNRYEVFTMIYYLPIWENEMVVCYEQRLFSTGLTTCRMPQYRGNVDDNPVVHITVTIDPTSSANTWVSRFFMVYVDPKTMERVECEVYDESYPPRLPIIHDNTQGTYRLFVGNNPRSADAPKQRTRMATARAFRDPFAKYSTPDEQLREMIKKKVLSLQGPRLPKALRLFGNSMASFSILGIPLPPINEDTPFAWIRSELEIFKREHIDDIVDYLVQSMKKSQSVFTRSKQRVAGEKGFTPGTLYPDANASIFDVFHLAIYRKPLTAEDVHTNWDNWLIPSRPFPSEKVKRRVIAGDTILLDLRHLHSIYDDVQLELVEIPDTGCLRLYPSNKILTTSNISAFQTQPFEYQQHINFQPGCGKSLEGDLRDDLLGIGVLRPRVMLKYRIWNTTGGRSVNRNTASIEITTDKKKHPPRIRSPLINVSAIVNVPVRLQLAGGEDDSRFPRSGSTSRHESAEKKQSSGSWSIFKDDNLDLSMRSSLSTMDLPPLLQIVQLPRYGRLYDRNMGNQTAQLKLSNMYSTTELERYEIQPDSIAMNLYSTDLIYISDEMHGIDENALGDEFQYRLSDREAAVFSSIGHVRFHISSVDHSNDSPFIFPSSSTRAILEVDEDSRLLITLSEIEPLMGQVDSTARFMITSHPRHGELYHFHNSSADCDDAFPLGQRIEEEHPDVSDILGRLIYVPGMNYFNSFGDADNAAVERPLDSFSFMVRNLEAHLFKTENESASCGRVCWLREPRVIQIQVVNTPDKLVVLSPTIFTSNQSRGEPVSTPITFADVDESSKSYRVVLDAKDGVSTFELGHVITHDDILKYCGSERPCTLVRSMNASFDSNANGDDDEVSRKSLFYVVRTHIWDGSYIEVYGSRDAIQSAISQTTIRDWTVLTWESKHTTQFDVRIERINATMDAATTMTYHIEFSASEGNGGTVLTGVGDLLWVSMAVAAIATVLSNLACCSYGFCCCCNKARTRRRNEFENKHKEYMLQVVQNNHEYSLLLVEIADIIMAPDCRLGSCLLKTCERSTSTHRLAEAFCLESLLPVLESERQGTRFVFHLVQLEFDELIANTQDSEDDKCAMILVKEFMRYPSIASRAIVWISFRVGSSWLRDVIDDLSLQLDTEEGDVAMEYFVRIIEKQLEQIPVELVILSRSLSMLMMASPMSRYLDLAALNRLGIHIVFFNHFLGPAMWMPLPDCTSNPLTRSQRKSVQQVISQIVKHMTRQINVGNLGGSSSHYQETQLADGTSDMPALGQYEELLEKIATSPALGASFIPSTIANIDCELVGLCLMNLHSMFEASFFEMKATFVNEERLRGDESVDHDCTRNPEDECPVQQLQRILYSLGYPVANADVLVAAASRLWTKDNYLLSGYSFGDWETRISQDASSESKISEVAQSEQNEEQGQREPSHLQESVLTVEVRDGHEHMNPHNDATHQPSWSLSDPQSSTEAQTVPNFTVDWGDADSGSLLQKFPLQSRPLPYRRQRESIEFEF